MSNRISRRDFIQTGTVVAGLTAHPRERRLAVRRRFSRPE